MLFLPNKISENMATPLLHEIKKQASCFLKDKIKTARLVLTDVTPVELMAEEATSENQWPADTRSMRVISRAAFEVDDYWRIVEILHQRLLEFDKRNWRSSYKVLILLEHLLTHGPKRVFEEFQCDKDLIKEIGEFHYIDERGFNWGLRVKKLSERILKLLENVDFLREERVRARQLSRGIEGFGSFSERTSKMGGSIDDLPSKAYGRSNSYYDYPPNDEFVHLENKLSIADEKGKEPEVHGNMVPKLNSQEKILNSEDGFKTDDHPFVDKEKLTKASLLSMY